MNKFLLFLSFLLFLDQGLNAQCTFEANYSSNTGWTQLGTGVNISNNAVRFENANGGTQRRVYYTLGNTYSSTDTWAVEFDFTPEQLGLWSGEPATGATLFALTAGNQEPFNDCPDLACTGFPNGIQDAIILYLVSPNPPNGAIHFKLSVVKNAVEVQSGSIPYLGINNTHYIRLERNGEQDFTLNIFSNASRTSHLSGSPVNFNTAGTIVDNLNTVQHGMIARGFHLRELTGSIDNLCIAELNYSAPLPSFSKAGLLVFGLLILGLGSYFLSTK